MFDDGVNAALAVGNFWVRYYCFLHKEKNIKYQKERFSTVENREKEKSASSVKLLFHDHVGKPFRA
jgi:hypothetical protein